MNPLARNQNAPPRGTEREGESSAEPAPNPLTESLKPTEEAAPALKIPPILLEGDEPAALPAISELPPKFATGPTPGAVPVEQAILPEAYGSGRLWLAGRDPHCLYARWDLTSEQQTHYLALAREQPLCIRLHLETGPERGVVELKLPPDSHHCFVHVPFAGRQYFADLGYYRADQGWNSIAVSETVSTPPEGIAQDKSIRFASAPARGPSQRPPADTPVQRTPQTGSVSPRGVPEPVPVTDVDVSIVVPSAKVLSESALQEWPETGSSAEEFSEEFFPASAAGVSEWTPAQEEALADLINWSAARLRFPSSAELIEMLQAPFGIEGGVSSLPPEAVFSPIGGEVLEQKAFWLSVNAELVIYGATDPQAHITIGGHPIRLRPDGTFSYRFALPEGHYQLPIVATSVQGEQRGADLEFSRGTTYYGEVQAHPQDPDLKKPGGGNLT